MSNNLLTWQDIDPYHKRAAVPGGWLVKTYEDVMTPRDTYCGMRGERGYEWRVSMCFVPDEGHYWKSDWSKE